MMKELVHVIAKACVFQTNIWLKPLLIQNTKYNLCLAEIDNMQFMHTIT